MTFLLILYLITVVVSFYVLSKEYLQGLEEGYDFSWQEKLIGLFLMPMCPVFNIGLVLVIIFGKAD